MRIASQTPLDLSPSLTAFRDEMRTWIGENAPRGLSELVDWYDGVTLHTASNRDAQAHARRSAEYEAWDRTLTASRMIYPHWPEHAGGRGWSALQTAIFVEECHRAGVPRVKRGFGADLVSTAILLHGSREQQEHFLPRIVDGSDRYCQGFSEPNHGSDLASIETVGVVDGDEIVITGQKVWTSEFDAANMIFLLCRTDPSAPRDSALSFVIVPFDAANGVEVRGIRQMTGAADFAEDFFDGARAPLDHVIGGVGNGWGVAMSTLTTERTIDLLTMHLGYADEVSALARTAEANESLHESGIRHRLADALIDTIVMQAQAAEVMSDADGHRDLGGIASAAKLFWSEHSIRMGELALDVMGPAAVIRPAEDFLEAIDGSYAVNRWQDLFLASRAGPIFSGSNEIQKNLIAERVLGLPREPRGTQGVLRGGPEASHR